jgi:hypothetical protein
MAAGPWIAVNGGRSDILDAGQHIDSDSYKMALLTSASNLTAASTTFAGLTGEVSNTGYTAGGIALAMTKSGTTTVTAVMTTAPVWTAGTATLTAKWAAIYKVAGNVLFFALLDSGGADVSATSGNTYTVGSNGGTVFTVA